MKKSAALFFEIHKSSTKPYGYIRSSYRKNGKVCHDTISSISGCSLEQLKSMKAAFDGKPFSCDDIVVTSGREYGASDMLFSLAKRIGLDKIIYSRNEDWVKCSLAMIIGRIVYGGSKLNLSKVSELSCLWEICGINCDKIDVDEHCYDAMDELLARQELIQKKLAKKHLYEGSAILYDITSSYFEGEYLSSEIVAYGYNRDKKQGKKQITIGLICTKEGCPVGVEVFAGNTTDCTTVGDKMKEIKNKYGITSFVFVGDRGMLTQKNIDECDDNTETITALTHSAMKKLCEHENVQLSLFDENMITEVILPEEPNIRYALKKNPIRLEKERKSRSRLIEKTEEELDKIAVPKKKTDDKTLIGRASKIFAKYKTEKYFKWDVNNALLTFSRRTEVIKEDELYDGFYVIRTDVPSNSMDICEVVNTYKSLINVEHAFRNMKTVELELRPIYHKTDDRIKAHVLICMLAYYLLWHMSKALKPLYGDNYNHSQTYIIETMKTLQKQKIIVGSIETLNIANPTDFQKQIQDLLSLCG
jgi:transposase